MRKFTLPLLLILVAACSYEDMACISIGNNTGIPIFSLPYSEEYTNGEWIQPGSINEFYTLNNDQLDGFEYFSYYYDSLVIHIKGQDNRPVKFYKDGRTINYNPELNPFINPNVWKVRKNSVNPSGSAFEGFEEKKMVEHYFTISANNVLSLSDSIASQSEPAD